jgi:hypothetical protein
VTNQIQYKAKHLLRSQGYYVIQIKDLLRVVRLHHYNRVESTIINKVRDCSKLNNLVKLIQIRLRGCILLDLFRINLMLSFKLCI